MGDAGLMWSPQFNYENGEPSHLLPGNRTFRRRARCSTLLILANCFSTSAAARPVWREVTANGSWPQPRYSHTAAMSPSGEVLMFGGNMYDPTNDLYVFDLVRSEWSKVKAQGTPPAKRYGHTATVTSDGRMIVVGGFDGKHFLNDVHELSHVNGTYSWRSVPALGCAPSARDGHTATLAEGNRTLLIVGGFDGMRQLDDVHSLDLQSFEWRQLHCEQAKGERPAPRCLHAALPMDGGALLFGGYAVVDDESGDGDDVWFSDLWRLRLLQSEDMDSGDTQSEDLQGTGSDGTGSHGTGVASSAQSGGALQVVWERVEAVGASPPPLSGHALAADSRGRVWLFGGYAHGAFKNDLHVLSPRDADARSNATFEWQSVRPSGKAPSPRHKHTMVAGNDGRLLLFGGHDFTVTRGFFELDTSVVGAEASAAVAHRVQDAQSKFVIGLARVVALALLTFGLSSQQPLLVRMGVALLAMTDAHRLRSVLRPLWQRFPARSRSALLERGTSDAQLRLPLPAQPLK
uniref:Uncharacterized protein n=1 Tax=Chrysotila carterae TaxID=13221 RepID=A0A7S4B7F2_CHRCT